MKAMVFSDLITMKRNLLQLLGICVLVALFISVGTETLVTTGACIAAMVPIMYLFSIAAYDEMNKWEVFRLTLPLSRKQVVAGRYASFLLVAVASCVLGIALCLVLGLVAGAVAGGVGEDPQGMLYTLSMLALDNTGVEATMGGCVGGFVVVMIMAAASLPFIMRFGMMRAVRIIPLAIAAVLFLFVTLFTGDGPFAYLLPDMTQWLFDGVGLRVLIAGLVVATAVLFAVSFAVAARLYVHREL